MPRPYLKLKDESMKTLLCESSTLSGEVITVFLRLLEIRSLIYDLCFKCWCHDSMLYLRMHNKYNVKDLIDISTDLSFLTHFTFTPVLITNENALCHWILVVTIPSIRKIVIIDPLKKRRPLVAKKMLEFVEKVAALRKHRFNPREWSFRYEKGHCGQKNLADSGVLVCFYAEQILLNGKIPKTSYSIPEIRERIACTIRKGVLLNRCDPVGCLDPHELERPNTSILWIDHRDRIPDGNFAAFWSSLHRYKDVHLDKYGELNYKLAIDDVEDSRSKRHRNINEEKNREHRKNEKKPRREEKTSLNLKI